MGARTTGVSDEGLGGPVAAHPETEHHRRGPDVVQGQEAAEDDPGDIRIVRHVLPSHHHQ